MDHLLVLLLGSCVRRAVAAPTMLENVALRHQLGVLTQACLRPRMTATDRWFWVVLRRVGRRWSEVLVFVKSETVVCWHRAGFRLYWNGAPTAVSRVGPTPRDAPISIASGGTS